MPRVLSNGLDIEVEQYGESSNPAVLLIMGLAAQLTFWPPKFIDSLVSDGFHVVAFDNRDVGLSQKLRSKRSPEPSLVSLMNLIGLARIVAPYRLTDMAKDAAGILEVLKIDRAHVIGASMGGMIGQILAAEYPHQTMSFTAIMSSTNNPELPKTKRNISNAILTGRTKPRSRDDLINHTMHIWDLIGTKNSGNDPEDFRERIAASIDRNTSPDGIRRQIAAIIATRDLRPWTSRIKAPSLVIHGSDDRLVPHQCGRDIAATIRDSRLEIIEGMGHDLPPRLLPSITKQVLAHLRAVENEVGLGRHDSKTSVDAPLRRTTC